ncbi:MULTISPECIES: hypothetical protein [Nocardia]|uniref:hypothetical protein n=1 Tax=Nocardia TaxID=1817 RepID=UPI000AACD277|nr:MULTISPECIES: hypothetical protein [Nocardia]MBF6272886.1 hypothetical protein [Nocardia nova]
MLNLLLMILPVCTDTDRIDARIVGDAILGAGGDSGSAGCARADGGRPGFDPERLWCLHMRFVA